MHNAAAIDTRADAAPSLQAATAHLADLARRLGRRFARAEPRQRALAYLRGLLAPVERKNAWQLAECLGYEAPYPVQHLLGRAKWDAEAVRDDLRAYVTDHLGREDAVLVVDETGFLKKGAHSVGVQRQYSGTAGRVENCQVGVFLAYSTGRGTAFIDRALYLPKSWTDEAARLRGAGVPEGVPFATKPELARQMLRRACEAGIRPAWVVADSIYGDDRRLRLELEARRQAYVLAVSGKDYVWAGFRQHRVGEVLRGLPDEGWARLSAGAGSKGPRLYDWIWCELNPVFDEDGEPTSWRRRLLVRRSLGEPSEVAAFVVHAPEAVTLEEAVSVAGRRWVIETAFEQAKGGCGLDEYEVRSWHGWHRHVTLALLAHALLSAVRAEATGAVRAPEKSAVGAC